MQLKVSYLRRNTLMSPLAKVDPAKVQGTARPKYDDNKVPSYSWMMNPSGFKLEKMMHLNSVS